MSFAIQAIMAWLPLLLIAVLHELAFLRLLSARLGTQKAIAASLPSLLLLLLLYSLWAIDFFGLHTPVLQLLTGAIWAALTVAFEFLFWHYAGKKSWQEIAARFGPTTGDGTLLLVAIVAVLPLLAGLLPWRPW